MLQKKTYLIILTVSLGLAIGCGLLDYKTQSLVHLLTAEGGNVLALFLYTAVFATFGVLAAIVAKSALNMWPNR